MRLGQVVYTTSSHHREARSGIFFSVFRRAGVDILRPQKLRVVLSTRSVLQECKADWLQVRHKVASVALDVRPGWRIGLPVRKELIELGIRKLLIGTQLNLLLSGEVD